jgi:hypothetical protein
MVQVYKILSESDVSYSGQWFGKMENARQTRHVDGPQLRAGHKFWHGFFSVRAVDRWNSLPRHIKEAATVNSFKSQYRLHIRSRVAQTEDRLC